MEINWLTANLGTASYHQSLLSSNYRVIDLRDLVDKKGNDAATVREKMDAAVTFFKQGEKVIICCDYGISRSNAVAIGVYALIKEMPFYDALAEFIDNYPALEIKTELLRVVGAALNTNKAHETTKTKRILLTGSSGFLGQSVKKELSSKFTIFAPGRQEMNIETDITKCYAFVGKEQVDCIVHLANPRIYTSNRALGHSLTMLRNVIDVCVSENIHLIYPSSWEVYSGYQGNIIANEALPLLPKGPYGDTKYLCETMLSHHKATRNLKCTLLRFSPVYGLGSDKPKFIYNFIEKAKRGEDIVTHHYLNGDPSLDLMAIDDLAAAVLSAAELRPNDAFNIGTGTATSTFDIAQYINESFGGHSRISKAEIRDYVANITMDTSKARELFNWQPRIHFKDGLDFLIKSCTEGAARQ